MIRLKYQTEVNRWTRLADPPVALLQEATRGEPFRSLVWRELLSGYGIGDVASVGFRARYGCRSFLELWRSGSDARFTSAEAGFLTDIVPVVTQALRRTQAETFVVGGRDARRVGPVVLLLSAGLEVLAQKPDMEKYLRVIVPPEEGNAPIPATAYNVSAQLLAVEAGIDHHAPSSRLHLSGGVWVTMRAARIGDVRLRKNVTSP